MAATMNAEVASILEQMKAQQVQQQQQHDTLMNRLIEQQTSQAPMGPRDNGGGNGERQLIAKYFQCPQFTGKVESWSDFAFRFKRATRSQSPEAHDMLSYGQRGMLPRTTWRTRTTTTTHCCQARCTISYVSKWTVRDFLFSKPCRGRATDSRRETSCTANTTLRRFHVDSNY